MVGEAVLSGAEDPTSATPPRQCRPPPTGVWAALCRPRLRDFELGPSTLDPASLHQSRMYPGSKGVRRDGLSALLHALLHETPKPNPKARFRGG